MVVEALDSLPLVKRHPFGKPQLTLLATSPLHHPPLDPNQPLDRLLLQLLQPVVVAACLEGLQTQAVQVHSHSGNRRAATMHPLLEEAYLDRAAPQFLARAPHLGKVLPFSAVQAHLQQQQRHLLHSALRNHQHLAPIPLDQYLANRKVATQTSLDRRLPPVGGFLAQAAIVLVVVSLAVLVVNPARKLPTRTHLDHPTLVLGHPALQVSIF
ncbi:hypothetical protein AB205_0169800 [Aquarana catesbeiana]|uniref:Uncharacterized protein n=1 Tax=Aquarana catesbeiana TaxID=8400 RepID=A0A2G9SAB9_AQUCT|nr:hypothetical protein AB205_0169800 [Aquarana catesbeiana]